MFSLADICLENHLGMLATHYVEFPGFRFSLIFIFCLTYVLFGCIHLCSYFGLFVLE